MQFKMEVVSDQFTRGKMVLVSICSSMTNEDAIKLTMNGVMTKTKIRILALVFSSGILTFFHKCF